MCVCEREKESVCVCVRERATYRHTGILGVNLSYLEFVTHLSDIYAVRDRYTDIRTHRHINIQTQRHTDIWAD